MELIVFRSLSCKTTIAKYPNISNSFKTSGSYSDSFFAGIKRVKFFIYKILKYLLKENQKNINIELILF